MEILFLQYPKCGTCRKAKKWLNDNKINVSERHIVEEKPTFNEIKKWHSMSGLPLKKFFNTSGKIYKEKKLKDIIPNLTETEIYNVLSNEGMLVKRPILVLKDKVLVGFKEEDWAKALL